ncbi:SOS response-associated peptidase [Vallicoccus soli]|uniref:Abasic site processing protein n=1 Tax=Vallicoccus soli TaxID=2339232 RepID=A0A3A3Z3W0_9ACTN|nr:SOS response-associated peptidase [Vallicoccus soli]RJK98112.1 SOS response-associated peptidase [Vallicoccus soli]
MCGRYAASRRPEDLVEEFEVEDPPEGPAAELPPRWNVAPTDPVRVVLQRRPRGEPEAPARRQLRVARWGLVPSWAKDPSVGSRMINARVETVAEKPAFAKAFASRRCLVPADGYYEWYKTEDPAGKPRKQPFFIHSRDGRSLAMAGLYEWWRDPAGEGEDAWLLSCTVITTTATDDLGHLHDRSPMLVDRERWGPWLDPGTGDAEALRGLLVPAAPGLLEAHPVSPAVGNVRNDGPQLVEPLPAPA